MAIVQSGYFTSDGNAKQLNIVSSFDTFRLYIQGNSSGDNWESTANPGVVKQAFWFRGMANDTALTIKNTNGAATDTSDFIASGGFLPYDFGNPPSFAELTISSIAKATSVVTTSGNHNLTTGDIVRIYDNTVMTQIGGMTFTVTVTGATTFTIPINLNTANFADETSAKCKRLFTYNQWFPRNHFVTGITAANPAVITTATAHGYVAGEYIRVKCPAVFGMTEIDGLQTKIASVTSTTITTDIDASGFTAFAWPATTALPMSFAEVNPIGETATILTQAEINNGSRGMIVGSNVCGPNGALVLWVAEKSDAVQTS
jgi:hypothetical protein